MFRSGNSRIRIGVLFAVALLISLAGLAGTAVADDECGQWSAGFEPRGLNSTVTSLAWFDDGTGEALYAAGFFTTAGDAVVNHIAKWDAEKSQWVALGSGVEHPTQVTVINALAVFDDGSGPALYAAGRFTSADGVTVQNIARWDGSAWSSVGGGIPLVNHRQVRSLAVFDDGSGPALYAGGTGFQSAGTGIVKWDGSAWAAVGGGIPDGGCCAGVYTMTAYDDGSGNALFVGGQFTTAGGTSANNIAKWDGASWSPLGAGLTGGHPVALAVFDDGSGAALYTGGLFTNAGAVPVSRIARWDGSTWSDVGGGVDHSWSLAHVAALAAIGSHLYVGGSFEIAGGAPAHKLAKWNGSAWSSGWSEVLTMASGSPGVFAILEGHTGSDTVVVGGVFHAVDGVPADYIAQFDGSVWSALDSLDGIGTLPIMGAMRTWDDGSGEAVYVVTNMPFYAGSTLINRIGKWDGSQWSPLGTGIEATGGTTRVMTVFDDGSEFGEALYVASGAMQGGQNSGIAGGIPVNRIARWNGQKWGALPGDEVLGLADILALEVYDDGSGSGPQLYLGSNHSATGRIVKWTGSEFLTVGGGINDGQVNALASFDDGTGEALYVAGTFTNVDVWNPKTEAWEGTGILRIAKWDGEQWSAMGDGFTGTVHDLAVFENALYAAGDFSFQDTRVAKWDGEQWSPVGAAWPVGVPNPRLLAVLDDGSGPALYVSHGPFGQHGIRKWDGTQWVEWVAFPGGSGNFPPQMAQFGTDIYIGSEFGGVDDGESVVVSNNFARYHGCPEPVCAPADFDCNGFVNVFDLLELLGAWGPCPGGECEGACSMLGACSCDDQCEIFGDCCPGVCDDCEHGFCAATCAASPNSPMCTPAVPCPADLDGNRTVNVFDLLELLGNWGPTG